MVDPCMLSMVFMKGLDDRLELLKQQFAVNPKKYARLSVEELHHELMQCMASAQHLLHSPVPRSAGHASSGAGGSSNPKKASSPLSVDDIKQLAAAGNCLCGQDFHTIDRCGQFISAGYCIELNEEKAKQKGGSLGMGSRLKGKCSGGGHGSSNTSASSASASAPAPAALVGSASRASSN